MAEIGNAWGLVLIVEDEPQLRRFAAQVLRRIGFEVLVAMEGSDGVRLVREHRDELRAVILDHQMPGMDGVDTLKTLRREFPQLPVVMMSGAPQDEWAANIGPDPALLFLQKPFTVPELQQTVERAAAMKA